MTYIILSFDIVEISAYSKLIYRFNTISINIKQVICKNCPTDFKMCISCVTAISICKKVFETSAGPDLCPFILL